MRKYTILDFQKQFPDEAACLNWLRDYRWPDGIHCKNCGEITNHYLANTRQSFCCQNCGNHVHPTVNTIAHKSRTPLVIWFYVVFQMAQTRGGISAKQIERETGVTYKTAHRMCKRVRERLSEGSDPLGGEVEIDESYFGGRRRGKRGRAAEGKTPVLGMAQRKGRLKATAVPDVKSQTVLPLIYQNVARGSSVYTDEYPIYNKVSRLGFQHDKILHSNKIYVRGNVHTNTIEGFWALVKNGIRGVYHSVSPEYLQNYLDEYVFRYNHRDDETPMFITFLRRMFHPQYQV